ncbi:MAG: hypothetical protein H0X17_06310 [Deltaproteobacteria bacterium]|nr:hypothetical protein [Deltaproteobacteria bacterium]
MLTDSGVTKIRLRGTSTVLSSMLPGLYTLGARCQTFGSFMDEALRYLASARLDVMTLEYHAGTREVTFLVRGG